jgi:hypothetical protein
MLVGLRDSIVKAYFWHDAISQQRLYLVILDFTLGEPYKIKWTNSNSRVMVYFLHQSFIWRLYGYGSENIVCTL